MLALEEKRPLYEYAKGGVPLIRVYAGEAVGETLDIENGPEARDVGLANVLVVCGGVLAVLYVLLRGQRGEERQKQQVASRGRAVR
jgi:hypothetical protein